MKKVLAYLIKFILAIAGVLGSIFGFLWLQSSLSNNKDYIIFVSPNINLVISIFICFSIVMLLRRIILKRKLLDDEFDSRNDEISDNDYIMEFLNFIEPKKHIVYPILIIFYCILTSYALTNYSVIYENSIKKYSIIYPNGKDYTWNDVKDVKVGITKSRKRQYDFYYTIELKDNSSINLNSSNETRGKEIHDILLEVDNKIKKKHIPKIIDKTNLNNYGTGLDEIYIEKIRKLFVE
ncbi:hypothetical protein [Clostridium lundense]|uniref:hypothetical protein n=1 Tax=Clostridium lundense TaxID=319475 RepID=UPI0004884610|nr:hypothetical protein [Clostridium lundense]